MRRVLVLLLALVCGCAARPPVDRAMSLMREGREPDAVKVLREDLAKHPDDLPARKLLVRVLAFQGNMGAARVEVGEIARRVPSGDPTPWIELGHAYELVHQFDEALAAYDEAADRAPASPAGPREGGMRCARWGEVAEARPRLEEAVRRGARDAETFHALGLVRLHLQDLAGAEAAYRAGLKADPDDATNLLGLATVAVVRDDAGAALTAYDALMARHPRYAAGELGRAWALAKLGRTAEAKQALDHAEELGAPAANVAKQRAALAGR